MDETSLRELFERVVEPEPPIGTVAQNGIRAGIRLRRRRRAQRAVAGAAAVAVTCAAVAAATSLGGSHGSPAASAGSGTAYVLGYNLRVGLHSPGSPAKFSITTAVTPISTATNTVGTPIGVLNASVSNMLPNAASLDTMAATPDGKMIYVEDPDNAITPVSTVTGTAGQPIPLSRDQGQGLSPVGMVATPDGKTVYVLAEDGELTPISTATNTPGPPIWVTPPGTTQGQALAGSIAITPDGKTLYVGVDSQPETAASGTTGYVIPVDTATSRPGRPIRFAGGTARIMISPDGGTGYVIGGVPGDSPSSWSFKITVTPFATATNTPGPSVIAGSGVMSRPVVMTPDGRHIYIAASSPTTPPTFSLISFSTAANSPGKQISFGFQEILALAAAPDGQTVYAASEKLTNDSTRCPEAAGLVTPIATATSRPGKPVQVACTPNALAVTKDSKTVYVASYDQSQGGHSRFANLAGQGTVTPIAAATGQAGPPIEVNGDPTDVLIIP